MCCYLLGVPEIDKPGISECPHCMSGISCGIYQDRPRTCRDYSCLWLVHPNIDDAWYPPAAHMVLDMVDDIIRVTLDPACPDRWHDEPYFSKLVRWSEDRDVAVSLNGEWKRV